jgi:hypothetical protein
VLNPTVTLGAARFITGVATRVDAGKIGRGSPDRPVLGIAVRVPTVDAQAELLAIGNPSPSVPLTVPSLPQALASKASPSFSVSSFCRSQLLGVIRRVYGNAVRCGLSSPMRCPRTAEAHGMTEIAPDVLEAVKADQAKLRS